MDILCKKRAAIKGRLTSFKNYVELVRLIPVENLNDDQISELKMRLAKLDSNFNSFDTLQTEIELLAEGDEQANQAKEREDVENIFFLNMSKAQVIVDKFSKCIEKGNVDIPKQVGQSGLSPNNSCSVHSELSILPRIKLPSFNGNYSLWLEFRDTYESLVHHNVAIDPINKYHHLKASLEGSAAEVIKSLDVSADNYNIAWELICERYNSERQLLNNHLHSLFSIESINKESDVALRNLIDHINKNVRALKSLKQPVEHWDTIIIYFASMKLDSNTARQWEESKCRMSDLPNLAAFCKFLRTRAEVLEMVKVSKGSSSLKVEKVSHLVASIESNCIVCNKNHKIFHCPKFKDMTVESRNEIVWKYKLCINCLNSGHFASSCKYRPCSLCKFKHNIMLHKVKDDTVNKMEVAPSSVNLVVDKDASSTPAASYAVNKTVLSTMTTQQVLLTTALVYIENKFTNVKECVRALLDSGSQTSIITSELCQRLGLKCNKTTVPTTVSGIGNMKLNIVDICDFDIYSRDSEYSFNVAGSMVVPQITKLIPSIEVDCNDWNLSPDIVLADPHFYQPDKIDLLIGADLFWDILRNGRIKLGKGFPILLESWFGWLVSGPIGFQSNSCGINNMHCNLNLLDQMERFWKLEDLNEGEKVSVNDIFCEQHFLANTYRTDTGRFCVKMPLHTSPNKLGDSYNIAKSRLYSLEKRFIRQPSIKEMYIEFIEEYERLGHLTEISKPVFGCYLPHHPVLREKSETTKCRVVFNASEKTSSGFSLNDLQAIGPTIQDDLFSILLRFRQHNYVVTADIEKMYRQILIDETQRNLQLILWRSNEDQPIKVLRLATVTYGTCSAPFLSTRCLFQLASECPADDICFRIKHDFYMDDLLTGCQSIERLNQVVDSISSLLSSAGLSLRKFRTNSVYGIKNQVFNENKPISDESNLSSTLGIVWAPERDVFIFLMKFEPESTLLTKRIMLSSIARVFDPLGLLSIFIIRAKIMLQKLWTTKSEWDDAVNDDVKKLWKDFVNSVNRLNNIEVPRHALCSQVTSIELHLFSDASLMAYGTCAYLRSIDHTGKVYSILLCAKSRVAPLKDLTVPRLELCGCLLAAELGERIIKAMTVKIAQIVYWTDSTVALSWIHASMDKKLDVFVSNRVNKIRKLTENREWRHVPTKENPADLISRGVESFSEDIHKFWFSGPPFLLNDKKIWPQTFVKVWNNHEHYNFLIDSVSETGNEIIKFENYSSLSHLVRVMAYVLRFISNCKTKQEKNVGVLELDELNESNLSLVKLSQALSFNNEITLLKRNKSLNNNSRLLSLSPFLDDKGVLRVGGRLNNSTYSYDKMHPIILSSNNRLALLVFEHEHKTLMHAGPQLLLYSVRERYWVVNGRNLARRVYSNCILCKRMRGKPFIPIMGNLPKQRIEPGIPFDTTGVDFAGPFYITDRKGRGCKISKCYLCIFVCFRTKALHLEAVSDLSKEAFILTLRRFVARRGKPNLIYCDNGTNFVGASNDLGKFLKDNIANVTSYGANEGIKFIFSPAYSPNFGGLWEAGVKSAKFHIKRVLGDRHLTFEELSSLFAQVEAILNSRPLCPMSNDPNDLISLTPGHFLIGKSLISIPTPDLTNLNEHRLARYEKLEQMRQHFWQRWHSEYLSELQHKVKWKQNYASLNIGDMVIIKEDGCPPLKWRTGRIVHLYPGSDGVPRVADVRTQAGTLRRALNRLCPLLLNPEDPTGEDVNASITKR